MPRVSDFGPLLFGIGCLLSCTGAWRHLIKATEVTAGMAGLCHDSLHVTYGLTACTPGSAPSPTLANEYGKTLPFYLFVSYSSRTSVNTMVPSSNSTQMTLTQLYIARTPSDPTNELSALLKPVWRNYKLSFTQTAWLKSGKFRLTPYSLHQSFS